MLAQAVVETEVSSRSVAVTSTASGGSSLPYAFARGDQSARARRGFPFSTTYVASSAALPLPTFFTAWIASAGDAQGIARLDRRRRLALDLILQRPLEDVDDLFVRMRVLDGRGLGFRDRLRPSPPPPNRSGSDLCRRATG